VCVWTRNLLKLLTFCQVKDRIPETCENIQRAVIESGNLHISEHRSGHRTWNWRRIFIAVRSSRLILALWKKSKPAIPAPRESFESSIYLSFDEPVQWVSQEIQVPTGNV